MISQEELAELRTRLRKGALTPEDVKNIDKLLASFKVKSLGKVEAGRTIVAHLPGGLDLVK